MLGKTVGSGPTGVVDAMGDGVNCGDGLGSTGALSSGCAAGCDDAFAMGGRCPEEPNAEAPMTLAAATMQHERRRRPSTYAIA
jgi:hypothetical protein